MTRTFTVKGSGLSLIPTDAVGLMASSNDEPLKHLNSTESIVLTTIQVVNDAELIANNGRHNIGGLSYLGGIVSADRQNVYWVNDTEPLPQE